MQRLLLIDGLRGYFLVFMLVNHLIFQGDSWLVHVNLRELSFVEDAQGFVFLSGLLVGLIHAPKMLKRGFAAGALAIHKRAVQIYIYALGLIALAVIAVAVVPGAQAFWSDWLGDIASAGPGRLRSTPLLLYQPTFMDILPQYIVYMVFAPAVVWFCLRGRPVVVLAGSFLLWLTVQFGWHQPAVNAVDRWLAGNGALGVRASFNLVAWQIVFFAGAVLGVLTALGRLNWDRVFRPDRTLLPKIALGICILLLPLRVASAHGFMSQDLFDRFSPFANRTEFGPVYLVNFIAASFGLTWLLVAGRQSPHAWIRRLSGALAGLFRLSFLRLLGRHSLQVYAWHVLIIYGVHYWDQSAGPFTGSTKAVIGLGCVALLAIPPLWRERDRIARSFVLKVGGAGDSTRSSGAPTPACVGSAEESNGVANAFAANQ